MWELREPRDLRVAVAVWELREPTAKICYTGINIGHFYHGLYLQTCRFRLVMGWVPKTRVPGGSG